MVKANSCGAPPPFRPTQKVASPGAHRQRIAPDSGQRDRSSRTSSRVYGSDDRIAGATFSPGGGLRSNEDISADQRNTEPLCAQGAHCVGGEGHPVRAGERGTVGQHSHHTALQSARKAADLAARNWQQHSRAFLHSGISRAEASGAAPAIDGLRREASIAQVRSSLRWQSPDAVVLTFFVPRRPSACQSVEGSQRQRRKIEVGVREMGRLVGDRQWAWVIGLGWVLSPSAPSSGISTCAFRNSPGADPNLAVFCERMEQRPSLIGSRPVPFLRCGYDPWRARCDCNGRAGHRLVGVESQAEPAAPGSACPLGQAPAVHVHRPVGPFRTAVGPRTCRLAFWKRREKPIEPSMADRQGCGGQTCTLEA